MVLLLVKYPMSLLSYLSFVEVLPDVEVETAAGFAQVNTMRITGLCSFHPVPVYC